MNLGPHVLIIAKTMSNNLSVSSFQLHDNNMGDNIVSELFSILGINKDHELAHIEHRLK
jgi:hypothetical protein